MRQLPKVQAITRTIVNTSSIGVFSFSRLISINNANQDLKKIKATKVEANFPNI